MVTIHRKTRALRQSARVAARFDRTLDPGDDGDASFATRCSGESRVGDAGRALVQNSSFVLISRPVSFAVNARSRRMEAPSSSDDAGLVAAESASARRA